MPIDIYPISGPCAPSVPRLTGDVSHKEGRGLKLADFVVI